MLAKFPDVVAKSVLQWRPTNYGLINYRARLARNAVWFSGKEPWEQQRILSYERNRAAETLTAPAGVSFRATILSTGVIISSPDGAYAFVHNHIPFSFTMEDEFLSRSLQVLFSS